MASQAEIQAVLHMEVQAGDPHARFVCALLDYKVLELIKILKEEGKYYWKTGASSD